MSKLAILSDKHTTNPDWFTKYRETAIDQLGIAPYEKDRPVVVYFDRESGVRSWLAPCSYLGMNLTAFPLSFSSLKERDS